MAVLSRQLLSSRVNCSIETWRLVHQEKEALAKIVNQKNWKEILGTALYLFNDFDLFSFMIELRNLHTDDVDMLR